MSEPTGIQRYWVLEHQLVADDNLSQAKYDDSDYEPVAKYADHVRVMEAQRKRFDDQVDYATKLQQLIESLRHEQTPHEGLHHHGIVRDFKQQLATAQNERHEQGRRAVELFDECQRMKQQVQSVIKEACDFEQDMEDRHGMDFTDEDGGRWPGDVVTQHIQQAQAAVWEQVVEKARQADNDSADPRWLLEWAEQQAQQAREK